MPGTGAPDFTAAVTHTGSPGMSWAETRAEMRQLVHPPPLTHPVWVAE